MSNETPLAVTAPLRFAYRASGKSKVCMFCNKSGARYICDRTISMAAHEACVQAIADSYISRMAARKRFEG